MKALVTGGAGFLGSHLVDALVSRGDTVTVLDNFRRGKRAHLAAHLESGSITLVEGDIREYDAVQAVSEGAEVIYHLAAQSNVMGAVEDREYSFTSNVVGTFNVLQAAAERGVRRIVFSSSREVYGEPDTLPVSEEAPLRAKNPYGASKVAGEVYCRTWQRSTGVECQVLRFANLYGPRDRDRVIPMWLQRALEGQELRLYGGQQVLDFLWVEHAVNALLAAAECSVNGPINVGSGQGVPLRELADRILNLTASNSQMQCEPARGVEVVRFVADVHKMREVLGVEPPADPLAGLAPMAASLAN
ncbi:MAG TPA: SDR family NAD(P)-dependent oxidoreductase [Dehalococcoidia bacterium]|jgi:UDP-glucose 4-epimerase|nr:SDR family NAD(P)-dependent oxidoreductase [Dehalococcoidia bacterium]